MTAFYFVLIGYVKHRDGFDYEY
ncbi:hypothetical protein AGR7A_Cc280037 [Agrobacterium deltaense NCPPB 1641]|uniref:Uncharacterized protein n=1 Tax=Agrobacterium deltaense NCPPB 1641 TaxID=1183425 RepID=A0A1S7TNQ8_9HYPH|nr:hypothetical protein AGR7A_Cc280037 [Agrobacterium deltaense NCPPB 1641]